MLAHARKSIALALLATGLMLSGCGDKDETTAPTASQTDAAFAAEMIAHHRGAVEMAEAAKKHAEHEEVRKLAAAIIAAQTTEIDQLEGLLTVLKTEGVTPGTSLGMSEGEMGMDFDASKLGDADEFDKAFIDAMIPHHRGAIAMAKKQLDSGSNVELSTMARAIIKAQTTEIEEMQAWRKQWYGAELPEPATKTMDHGSMDHEGM